jgi:hypothetical protein
MASQLVVEPNTGDTVVKKVVENFSEWNLEIKAGVDLRAVVKLLCGVEPYDFAV